MLGTSIKDLVFQAFSLWVCLLPKPILHLEHYQNSYCTRFKVEATDTSFNYFASFYVYTSGKWYIHVTLIEKHFFLPKMLFFYS